MSFKFTIGADPEFNLELDGKKLDAGQTIPALLKGHKEFKLKNMGYELLKFGNIGWDGHGPTGEIRPAPNKEPSKVVENLKEIFTKFNGIAPTIEISTLSRYAPVGGHIHFEIPASMSNVPGGPSNLKIQAIHKRIMSFMLPITLGENKVNLAIRIKGGSGDYGKYCTGGSFRIEPIFKRADGTQGYTYELRTPSAEWLTTPKIAQATLAYLAVVYHEILNNTKKFNKDNEDLIIRTNDMGNALQSLALTEYKILTKALFNEIKKKIKKFELYEQYKDEINYILDPNKVLEDKQKANYDIRLGWGLASMAKPVSKSTILSEKAFNEIAKKKDIEVISKVYALDYNNDLNVKIFVDRLQQKMAAFDWDLKKQYFIFGIRKGIESYLVMDHEKKMLKGLEIAKTTSDQKAIEKIMTNMYTKYTEGTEGEVKTKVNFATGKIEKISKNVVIVGIPYSDRLELNTKKFIETIYDIEKGTIKPAKRNGKEELINDDEKPDSEKGEIFKIINQITPEASLEGRVVEAPSGDEERTARNLEVMAIEKDIENKETEALEETENLLSPTTAEIGTLIDELVNEEDEETENDDQF